MLKWTVTKRSEELHDGQQQNQQNNQNVRNHQLQSRRSLGAINTKTRTPRRDSTTGKLQSRRSLGSCSNARKMFLNDKENCMTSTPYRVVPHQNTLAIALRDVSNLTPQTPVTPQSRKRPRPPQYASTLPTFDIEYSPTEAPFFALRGVADTYYENPRYFNNAEDPPPIKRARPQQSPTIPQQTSSRKNTFRQKTKAPNINNNNNNQSINSTLLGDTALEQMIDAILESAKKEKPTPKPVRRIIPKRRNSSLTPTYTAAEDPASDLKKFNDNQLYLSPEKYLEAAERTIIIANTGMYNEREVKTPDSISRNNNNEASTPPESSVCCLKRRKAVRRKCPKFGLTIPNGIPSETSSVEKSSMIGLTLPYGIPSPGTPKPLMRNFAQVRKSLGELAEMDTPQNFAIIIDSTSFPSKKPCDNTSTTPEIQATDLQGSSTPTGDSGSIRRCLTFSPDSCETSMEKRQSVASSTISRSSSVSTATSAKSTDATSNFCVTGSLDLAIFVDSGNTLNVHVIRCRDLHRLNGNSINAYVKVALLPTENNQETGFQRTAVHRNSTRPYFDHRFTFDLKDGDMMTKRVQLAVWHRDRECKRSEFLGCMSFPVKNVLKKEINGSFKLQPQSCLTNPLQPIAMGENSQSSVEEVISIDDGFTIGTGHATSAATTTANQQPFDAVTNPSTQFPSNAADDDGDGGGGISGSSTIAFSKKAIHQRDADENLFLRFLELDPPLEIAPAVTTAAGAAAVPGGPTNTTAPIAGTSGVCSGNRRQSSLKHNTGRTPFTITKRLTRTADRGFGFSIVWTHPPRIEKVESGLSADKCGIVPGDYVIFVDKHNVVTMPEMDILNLIRSQGTGLMLEIFRRPTGRPNGIKSARIASQTSVEESVMAAPITRNQSIPIVPNTPAMVMPPLSSTACSNTSISVETTSRSRRLHLPQVTFSKESILLPTLVDDQRRKVIYQLINREQNFVTAMQYGMERFVIPLKERKDLISPNDNRTLFQNIDELVQIAEDILEQLVQDDNEPHLNFLSRVYLSKTTAICAAYKKYCNGIKRADCVLVNKSRNTNSDFMNFIIEPPIPRKRPDLTTFIHRPLQHFREILKLIQITSSHCRADSEEYKNFTSIINDLQAAYREITVGGGLMEPLGEGRPLLTLQDLESRLVFTRCKPFILASPGRQWIFGGDLSRVEGRSVKPYWTLLFSDILLFAKVSRDRVLFITEDPVPLVNITDSFFNIRKKVTEFRLIIDPNGRQAESPTVHCAPDITRTPRRNSRKRSIILRAPSPELKAVWQNLLQRQIFLVNAALGTTPLNSPLESPDVIHTFVPFSDIGAATTSMASIKLSSVDSLPLQKNYHPAATTTSHHQPSPKQQKKVSKQLEELIDEKCRMLNKAGTSKGGALHLAQWMKGQLDKEAITNPIIETEQDDENLLDEWSPEMLKKRSRELQLVDANGVCQSLKSELSKRGMVEEILLSEVDEESKSPSRSTTSDSQITVRSSPNAKHNVDKVSVCLKCQKNCKNKSSHTLSSTSIKSSLHIQSQQSSTSTSQGATSNRCCHSSSASSQRSLVNSRASTLTEAFDYKLIGETGGAGGQESQTQTTADSSKDEVRYSDKNITKANCIEKHKVTSIENRIKCHTPCKCKCSPSEFNQDIGSPEETRQETCKIIENAYRIEKVDKTPNHVAKPNRHHHEQSSASDHSDCKCVCTMSTTTDGNSSNIMKHDEDDDWSLMLIGLAQINPTTSLVHMDPFEAVPTISVVPPTPESLTSRYNSIFSNQKSKSEEDDISPEDSPQDEEPPYKALHTPLRRYGTVSSLEKVPSDDTDEKTYNSSDDDDDEIDDELKITTKEIYSNTQSLRNWTARAGSYVAEKMSFFEESKAFFDKYLGRRETSLDQNDDETVEECTSGATSGEDVWGTPTSGGENEEMHMFNSDHTHSSPTKSSSSMTGDDDTELMMDELLMAPPMTASSIRGLLPRRRLEPLFEEDTESGEDSDEEEDVEDDDDDDDDDNIDGGNLYKGHPYADVVQINGHASRDSGEISGSGKSSPVTTPVERIAMEMTKKTTTPVDISEAMKIGVINYGSGADTSFSAGHPTVRKDVRDYVANTDTTASAIINHHQQSPVAFVAGLSPRLEMRLALNRDIMGDEDLINYDPGPDLTTLLGGDLSTYHRMTGKDLLNRSAAAMVAATSKAPQLRQAQTIFLQQKNSKMDTPTLNRKKSNLNTWNSSASVDQVDENGLTDLERLARREKMFSMSQLRSGRVAPQQPDPRARKISGSPDKLTLDLQTRNNKKNKFFNFLSSRRNSENHIIKSGFSQQDMSNDNEMATLIGGGDKDISLRKDVDKTLDRRFWKQLSKRRRSSSVSEVSSTS